jgi:hypothetical protein
MIGTVDIHPTLTHMVAPWQKMPIKISIAPLAPDDFVEWDGYHAEVALPTNLQAITDFFEGKQLMW